MNIENANVIQGRTIRIKYFDKEIDKVEPISVGNWIDLRAAETIELKFLSFQGFPNRGKQRRTDSAGAAAI